MSAPFARLCTVLNLIDSRRRVAALIIALAILLVAALGTVWSLSTGDGTSERADIIARIKSDPRMAGSSVKVIDCVADWYTTSATPEQRAAFLDDAVPHSEAEAPADPALIECLKLAAEQPA